MAGYFPTGTAGRGGGGGTGGIGGIGGSGGGTGGMAGMGGTGGTMMPPVIILMDGGADRTSISNPDANCGAKNKAAAKVAPDILLLLDRSGSMNDNIMNQMCRPDGGGAGMGCGAESKWALMIPAITQVITQTDTEVNWGLKFFPDSSAMACNVNMNAAVPIAPGNGAAIASAIMGATAANGGVMGFQGTPTASAATGATTYLRTVTGTNKKFVLLATDGLPTCASGSAMMDDSAAAVTAVGATAAAGYPVFVVGIATAGAGDTTLSNMANAGGLPRAGTPTYYPVASAAELEAAIRTLIGVAATCTFQIGPPPTDDGTTRLDRIDVFGDGTAIPRDTTHTNGYDYTDASMSAIEVYGPLCEKIKTAEIHDVTVTFQCIPL